MSTVKKILTLYFFAVYNRSTSKKDKKAKVKRKDADNHFALQPKTKEKILKPATMIKIFLHRNIKPTAFVVSRNSFLTYRVARLNYVTGYAQCYTKQDGQIEHCDFRPDEIDLKTD